jgi:hypothetical protein
MPLRLRSFSLVFVCVLSASTAGASPVQQPAAPQQQPAAGSAPSGSDSSAAAPAADTAAQTPQPEPSKVPEIDQMIVNLPTTMPMKAHHSYFRITHRFTRDLRRGTFSDLSQDLFSLDSGAIIGLEYRFALTSRIQAGVHRSILGKTINTFGRWDAWRQSDGSPVSVSVGASIEGQNNLHLDPQPGISATISRVYGPRLAIYATPTYVHNAHTGTLILSHGDHTHTSGEEDTDSTARDTGFVGLGARIQIRETVALVAEAAPRIAGYKPDRAAWNLGIEKLTGGHVLQLNFGNNFDTTPGMIARGGNTHDVYMGFNLSRKF